MVEDSIGQALRMPHPNLSVLPIESQPTVIPGSRERKRETERED